MLNRIRGISDLFFTSAADAGGIVRRVEAGRLSIRRSMNAHAYQTENDRAQHHRGNQRLIRGTAAARARAIAAIPSPTGPFSRQYFLAARQFLHRLAQARTDNPDASSAGLARSFARCAGENGLMLVTGATGSGKSTTLAAVLNEINATKPVHVVTLEDPVEFIHRTNRRPSTSANLGRISNFIRPVCAPRCARRRKSFSSVKCAIAKRLRRRW